MMLGFRSEMCMEVSLGAVFAEALRPERTWCIFQTSGSLMTRKCRWAYHCAKEVAGKVGRAISQRSWKPNSASKFFITHRMRSHSQTLSNEINQKNIVDKSCWQGKE